MAQDGLGDRIVFEGGLLVMEAEKGLAAVGSLDRLVARVWNFSRGGGVGKPLFQYLKNLNYEQGTMIY